jgi:ubiquinone/menaquinone biosynthesis C-methylase UbiE
VVYLKSENFLELEKLYDTRNPFVRNIFWGRIRSAISLAQINDDSILLDIGCGAGHLLRSIRHANKLCECWGTDIVESKIAETGNCRFQLADARSLPFADNYFSIVFSLDIFEHIKDVKSAIAEVHRVLMPGASAILSGPTETRFYRFCRSLLSSHLGKRPHSYEPVTRRENDYHYHTIYDLEKIFIECGFRQLERKRLPNAPLPQLFRVTKFQK